MNYNYDVVATGLSGKKYGYFIHLIGTNFKEVPANYIYAKKNPANNSWNPLYIGECENLKERCANHEKANCVHQNGGTHILAREASYNREVRLGEETDLRNAFLTPCNEQ